ncbi:hypothetical protein MMC10_009711 [Thelotrema lepadinum]|nr:hypothetical protein [Thelotrema lepadinum]
MALHLLITTIVTFFLFLSSTSAFPLNPNSQLGAFRITDMVLLGAGTPNNDPASPSYSPRLSINFTSSPKSDCWPIQNGTITCPNVCWIIVPMLMDGGSPAQPWVDCTGMLPDGTHSGIYAWNKWNSVLYLDYVTVPWGRDWLLPDGCTCVTEGAGGWCEESNPHTASHILLYPLDSNKAQAFPYIRFASQNDFLLREGITSSEISELQSLQFLSWENPPLPLRPIFFPILHRGSESRLTAIKEAAERFMKPDTANPNSYWAKIVDEDSNQIIAAHSWRIHHEDPFTGRPELEAVWWPEGERRRFATEWARRLYAPQRRYMRRPHACEVLPCHREMVVPG